MRGRCPAKDDLESFCSCRSACSFSVSHCTRESPSDICEALLSGPLDDWLYEVRAVYLKSPECLFLPKLWAHCLVPHVNDPFDHLCVDHPL
jgi:hypothetical protein